MSASHRSSQPSEGEVLEQFERVNNEILRKGCNAYRGMFTGLGKIVVFGLLGLTVGWVGTQFLLDSTYDKWIHPILVRILL